MAPYATVLIPTHDRAATLDIAVSSVQAQSVRDIEILIACDGATVEVLELARAIAAADPRIKVLEFEKGAGAGGVNRDRAIREFATSDRIFYTDDDDIWLSSHVEHIGPCLDEDHVVDTLPVAATRCDRLALAPVNSRNPFTRRLLAEDRLKLMYDTHLAHRRSAYLDLGAPWTHEVGGNIVRGMFAAFAAAPTIRWRTLPVVTAVSLHGGARAAANSVERRSELLAWRERLRDAAPSLLAEQSSAVWQLFSCLSLVASEPEESLGGYLARLGLSSKAAGDTHLLRLPIGTDQHELLETAFALHRRETVDRARMLEVAPLLLDTVKNAVASWAFLRRALSRLSLAHARQALAEIKPSHPRQAELLAIFEAYQYLWARQPEAAWSVASRLLATIELVPEEIDLVAGDILLALGRNDEGLEHLRRAVARTNRGSAIGLRLVNALIALGRHNEARHALDEAEQRLGLMPAIRKLRKRLEPKPAHAAEAGI